MEDLKKERGKEKGNVTKLCSKVKRHIEERDKESVIKVKEDLRNAFLNFEKIHDAVHDHLKENDEEAAANDDYFLEVQDKYTATLAEINEWMATLDIHKRQVSQADTTSEAHSHDAKGLETMLQTLSLPKLELQPFDGDPLQFHGFMSVFDEVVDKMSNDSTAKLAHLLQYTKGPVKDMIQPFAIVGGVKGYELARKALKERFGDNTLIAEKLISSLKNGDSIKSSSELQSLSNELTRCELILAQMGKVEELQSQRLITSVVDRLQQFRKTKWKKIAMDTKRSSGAYPVFSGLVQFIKEEAENENDPVYGENGLLHSARSSSTPSKAKYKQDGKKGVSFASSKSKVKKCLSCGDDHKLYVCTIFKRLTPEQMYKFLVDNKLCKNCLLDNHSTENCLRPSMCGIGGCKIKHSRFIHSVSPDVNSVMSAFSNVSSDVCVPVVEVKVNNVHSCLALLDTCSTSTFCSKRLADKLGIKGTPVEFNLSTLNGKEMTNKTSMIPSLCLESTSNGEIVILQGVYGVEEIPLNAMNVNVDEFDYLKNVKAKHNVNEVDLLIGQDNADLLIPLDVKKGGPNQPFAVRTLLGWSIHGNTKSHADFCGLMCTGKVSNKVVSHFVQARPKSNEINTKGDNRYSKCESFVKHDVNSKYVDEYKSIEEKVERLWQIDEEALSKNDLYDSMSIKDKEVLDLWDKNCKMIDNHYVLPIPWKNDITMPNDYEMAISRLNSLRHSLIKRDLYDRYDKEVQKLLDKGYAEKCNNESNDKIWYLPHHGVINDKKPEKLRLVFDCAAKYHSESLNDKCLQGPDMNNKLLHVLLRFRQHDFAVMADVQEMYYQVKVDINDRDALRFLWFNDQGMIEKYRMSAHVFGGIWCSSVATYAMRKTLENDVRDDLVENVIRRSFYVDDCLASFSSQSDAKKVYIDVKDTLRSGGFVLTKFITNDPVLMNMIDDKDRAKEVKSFGEEMKSKALGVSWNVRDDRFFVKIGVKTMGNIARRDMLSVIASMYDPLGLIAPCIIEGKLIFQEATRLRLSWKDRVPSSLENKWYSWLDGLICLQNVTFPRCIKTNVFNNAVLEIHNFSDASERAYGCCSYLRCVNGPEVSVILIMSKGRICPISKVTIPRLELQAAVLSSQINDMLVKELDIKIARSYFWTDSQIVLAYIQNTEKRFKTYVSNRVATIRSLSSPDQWHFVRGIENPADLVSRGVSPIQLESSCWKSGPEFLKHDLKLEDNVECYNVGPNDLEVKGMVVHVASVKEAGDVDHPIDKILCYSSDYYKAKRMIAWLVKVKDCLKRRDTHISDLTVQDINSAEILIIKHVQSTTYKSEITSLKSGSIVGKSSHIRNLLPVINEQGVVCVGGRLAKVVEESVCVHPYIVPGNHVLSDLIVKYYHDKAHQGTEWTLSLIRKKFWVTKARGLIKRVLKKCIVCKKLHGKLCEQQMANLPQERLEKCSAPFTYVGIDCFGPFYIKRGRSEIKRYGCVYTCLSIRGIHIEKLDNLETDSFVNGFRRFVSRRGHPQKVWSDNGTNIVGGSKELKGLINNLNKRKIYEYGLKENIDWIFNPPHASHMGGIYERQIRTIRKVLQGLLNGNNMTLSDEVLETLFCEVEFMVNSRPITKLSEDVDDMRALTPNQLLLLNNESAVISKQFDRREMYRRRWKFVQYLSNEFWKRWLGAYIPELQKRSKWLSRKPNLKKGDLVLLCEENTPRHLWPLGLIVEAKTSSDGLVRSVKVKTKSSILTRPISKLVSLEEDS